jgi:hypothetical protein
MLASSRLGAGSKKRDRYSTSESNQGLGSDFARFWSAKSPSRTIRTARGQTFRTRTSSGALGRSLVARARKHPFTSTTEFSIAGLGGSIPLEQILLL